MSLCAIARQRHLSSLWKKVFVALSLGLLKREFFVAVDYVVPQVLLSHFEVFVVRTSEIMTR